MAPMKRADGRARAVGLVELARRHRLAGALVVVTALVACGDDGAPANPDAPNGLPDGGAADGGTPDSTVGPDAPLICGDGLVVSPETCDDGNAIDGDGCTTTCVLSADRIGAYAGEGILQIVVNGNLRQCRLTLIGEVTPSGDVAFTGGCHGGVVEPLIGATGVDLRSVTLADGKLTWDGITEIVSTVAGGFRPTGTALSVATWAAQYPSNDPELAIVVHGEGTNLVLDGTIYVRSPAPGVCGDGAVDADENCDDAAYFADDGCTECAVDDGWECTGAPSSCVQVTCGNGFIDMGEDCDPADDPRCPDDCKLVRTVAASYTITGPTAAAYTTLTAGLPVVLSGSMDPNDDGRATLTLPFAFEYFGAAVTTVDVSANGFIAFETLGPGHANNPTFPSLVEPDATVGVYWEDWFIDPAITGAGIRRATVGTAPNRAFVIEWVNVRPWNQTTTNHRRVTMQVVLRETTHAIELRYGLTATTGMPQTAVSASVGIENALGTVGENILSCTPSCSGPPRPTNPNGFPQNSVITLTPVP